MISIYYINLQLTEKGCKVCGTSTKTLEMSWDSSCMPPEEEVNKFIEKEFITELVDHIISIKHDFRFLKINDYVSIVCPLEPEVKILGKVTHIQDDGYGHYITVHIEYPDNYGFITDFRFNFEGFEVGGSRKNKKYIEIPDPEFIRICEELKNIKDTYNKVFELLNYTYDWEEYEDTYAGQRTSLPLFLKAEELLKIYKILNDAKTRYEEIQVNNN